MDFYHLDKNVLSVLEDRFVNVTFGMSVSPACHQMNQSYRITVNTRTKSDSLEYDGTIVFWNNMCTYTYQTSTRCITQSGPAELYRKVNRSHVQIEWTWRDKDFRFGNFTSMRKELLLSVACKYKTSVCLGYCFDLYSTLKHTPTMMHVPTHPYSYIDCSNQISFLDICLLVL